MAISAIRMVPGSAPVVVKIGKELADLQAEVGGYISLVSLDAKTDAYVDDEGLLKGSPFNCVLPSQYGGGVPVVGNVIVVSHDNEGDTTGLSDAQIAKWLPKLAAAPRHYTGVENV